MLRMEVDAAPEALARLRNFLRSWLAEAGVCDDAADDALIAVDEAATNVVEHAYPGAAGGTMTVSASIDEGKLWLHVEDYGLWQTPRWDDSGEHGRGMELMRGLMDEVVVHTWSGGTGVHMRRHVNETHTS